MPPVGERPAVIVALKLPLFASHTPRPERFTMFLRFDRLVLLIAGLGMLPQPALRSQDAAAERPPVYSRQGAFSLPFQIGAAAKPEQEPAEVLLFVSEDRGQSWLPGGTARPTDRVLRFRAPKDGEYWFCVKTKDVSGAVRPEGPNTAQTRVIVDTSAPVLNLNATRTADGQVKVHYEAADANLAATRLRMAYRPAGSSTWTEIAVPEVATSSKEVCVGDAVFTPGGMAALEIRAEIQDLSGNPADAVSHVDEAMPISRSSVRTNPPADVSPPLTERSNDPFAATRPTDTRWPPEGTTRTPLAEVDPPATTTPGASASPPWASNSAPGAAFTHRGGDSRLTPVDTTKREPLRDTPRRVVNARRFEVTYDLGPVAAGKQRTATLWCTRDDGQSWQDLGSDRANAGRITAEVPEDGSYGLRIVSQTQGGIVEFPPARGDRPELTLYVDTAPPAVRLLRVDQYGEELVIAWETADSELADRPITLKCQARPEGPWLTIAANVDNSGRYAWKVRELFAHGSPSELVIAIEARDTAGNLGADVIDRPLRIKWPAQSGRFQTIDAVGK